jgi:hypothetical protein
MRWRRLALAIAAAVMAVGHAQAHLTPNSESNLDFGRDTAVADVIIPQGEYAFASGNPVGNTPRARAAATTYLLRQVSVTTPRGVPWTMAVERLEFAQIAGPPDLHAIVRLTPPRDAGSRQLTIDWRAVIDTVPNHFVLFVARSDFS